MIMLKIYIMKMLKKDLYQVSVEKKF